MTCDGYEEWFIETKPSRAIMSTPNQVVLLREFGWTVEAARQMTWREADLKIEWLWRNGWIEVEITQGSQRFVRVTPPLRPTLSTLHATGKRKHPRA